MHWNTVTIMNLSGTTCKSEIENYSNNCSLGISCKSNPVAVGVHCMLTCSTCILVTRDFMKNSSVSSGTPHYLKMETIQKHVEKMDDLKKKNTLVVSGKK